MIAVYGSLTKTNSRENSPKDSCLQSWRVVRKEMHVSEDSVTCNSNSCCSFSLHCERVYLTEVNLQAAERPSNPRDFISLTTWNHLKIELRIIRVMA